VIIESEFAGLDQLPAQADVNSASGDGVSLIAGKGGGQEPGVAIGQIATALTLPPGQVFSLLNAEGVVPTRLMSPGEASSRGNPVEGIGPDGVSGTGAHCPPTAIKSPAALYPSSHVSGDLTNVDPDDLPRPSSADLIASVLRLDSAAIEQAIVRYFHRFEDLDAADAVRHGPVRIVLISLALGSTFVALDVVRRRWRRWTEATDIRVRDRLPRGNHIGFPEFPASWTSRRP
jgi:hypothetical protein